MANNTVWYVVGGLAAFYLLTQRKTAPMPITPGTGVTPVPGSVNSGSILSTLTNLIKGSPTPGTSAAASNSDTSGNLTPQVYNSNFWGGGGANPPADPTVTNVTNNGPDQYGNPFGSPFYGIEPDPGGSDNSSLMYS